MPQTPVTDYVKFSTTVAGAQFAPAICALSGGGYVIVWEDDPSGKIYAQRFSASGQPVGSELHLDSVQGGDAIWVSVAATAADGFVIAFQAGFGNNSELYARRYDSLHNPVGGLFQANTTTANEQYNPHVTALDNGSILFTWDTRVTLGNDVVAQEVRGRIYDASGQPISANDFAIAPMTATDRHALSAIAPLAGGGFVVTWQRAANSSTNYEIVGQRYNASGGTVGAQFQANTQTTNNQYGNDVARLSDGGFVVSWVDPGAGNIGGRIVARHYDASGNAIGGEITVDSKASGAYGRTVVTALANGGYVVAWPDGENDTGVAHNVTARAFGANDQPLDPAFDMSFDSPFGANFFSDGAVTLTNGNVVFAWDGPSVTPPGGQPTGQDVYMRVYSFSGSTPPINGTSGPDDLSGTTGNDVMNGLGGSDILRGQEGNDTLNGNDGNDFLVGGPGNDIMAGGTGDDTYYVDSTLDAISEYAGEGNDRIATTITLALAADADIERIDVENLTSTNAIDITGSAIANIIYGNDGVNILRGEAGNDELRGFGGDDFLVGGPGTDVMIGGLGNDTFYVDDASDAIGENPGEGNDRIAASVSFVLSNGADVEIIEAVNVAATDALNFTGSDSANTITGNAGSNILRGEGGNDILNGAGGDDFLVGGAGNDVMNGGTGNDTYYVDSALDVVNEFAGEGTNDRVAASVTYILSANADVERLEADPQTGTNALNLTGSSIANFIGGNDGANVLDGRGGSDTLNGYGGADTFQFTTALGASNVDTIIGFVTGSDRIALDDAIFTGLSAGALNANAFFAGPSAHDADDRIIYNIATGQLSYDADGNGAGAAVLFATLQGNPALAASDFQVI